MPTQPLPDAAVCGVHDATGTLVVLFVVHVLVVQLFAADADAGAQFGTGVADVLFGVQTVVTQLLPALAAEGEHV
jgi:hypothetical protein